MSRTGWSQTPAAPPHAMFEIVLHEPQIPPNTGNVMRLCANTGARLHLIEPLGFVLSDRRLRRAGLDYEDRARTFVHASLVDCERMLAGRRWFAVSTRGERSYAPGAASCTRRRVPCASATRSSTAPSRSGRSSSSSPPESQRHA